MNRKRYVFLDRDGTTCADKHFLSDPDGVELLKGAVEGLRRMRDMGFGLVVVSNQSGVARGYFSAADVDRVNARLVELLAAEGVSLDGLFYCAHGPDDDCPCRKPRTGMVEQFASRNPFDPRECFVIGDRATDIELGRNLGAGTILVRTGYGAEAAAAGLSADHIADDLTEAATYLKERLSVKL